MISHNSYILWIAVLVFCSQIYSGDALAQVLGLKEEETTFKILDQKLENYDNRIRPFYGGKSDQISVRVVLLSVSEIGESNGDITTVLQLYQKWQDPRLALKGNLPEGIALKIDSKTLKKMWFPDTFFGNEKRSSLHEMTVANDYGLIFDNGTIIRSMRITLTSYCPFSYENFPFDSQECPIIIGSHAHVIQDVAYTWDDQNSLKISSNPHGGNFFVTRVHNGSYTLDFAHGEVSRLHLQIHLQRSWKPFITRFFFPMVLFTLVSVTSLWIADFQIGLLVNFFNIAFMNIFMAIRSTSSDIPRSVTRTYMDAYFLICIFYVIISTFVLSFEHHEHKKNVSRQLSSGGITGRFEGQSTEDSENFNGDVIYRMTTYQIKWYGKTRIICKKLKKLTALFCKNAKWLLPILFILTDFLFFTISATRFSVDHSNDKIE